MEWNDEETPEGLALGKDSNVGRRRRRAGYFFQLIT
jgi:hypothetical protein